MSGTLATIKELKSTHHNHPEFIVYTMAVHSTALDKCLRHVTTIKVFPGGSVVKNLFAVWRLGFDSWVRKIPCRKKWHPTPVLLPGKSHGRRSPVGYSPWGHKDSDTTEWLSMHATTIVASNKAFPPVLHYSTSSCVSPASRTTDIFTFYVCTYSHGTVDWFRIGKGVHQGCILPPCLFNLYAEYIMKNAGLDEAQGGIKIAGKISTTSDMQMTPPLWQKVKRN